MWHVGRNRGVMAEGEYTQLKDLKVRADRGLGGGGDGSGCEDDNDGFRICFWLFLAGITQPPFTVIHQMLDGEDRVPFLVLSEDEKLIFVLPRNMHREAHSSDDSFYWTESLSISSKLGSYLKKWIHIGYEVTRRCVRLHINGEVSAEKVVPFLPIQHLDEKTSNGLTLMGYDKDDRKVHGCIYNLQIMASSILISDHLSKDPPLQLSVNVSSISEGIEECDEDVWSIVVDKAECCRDFSVEVILKDALGHLVDKEIKLVASLVFVDDGTFSVKPNDNAEAPLQTHCNGFELFSANRPARLIHGRMSFKVKLPKFPSRCENQELLEVLHVHVQSTDAQKYPFLEAYSPAIYCISRNHHTSDCSDQKQSSTAHLADCSLSQKICEGSLTIQDNHGGADVQISDQSESVCKHSSKRLKVGKTEGRSSKHMIEHHGKMDGMSSDSESSDAKHTFKGTQDDTNPSSDALVFKYCLERTYERSVLLREIIASASEKDVMEFANQVSMYAGCSHHRHQILMAKQLVEEGVDLWHAVSRNKDHALWVDAIPEIKMKFQKISHACRSLSEQDIEVLQKIAGCGDTFSRESFEKLWSWLYPVAFAISNEKMNHLWECLAPKWIEGLITKEEAENALGGPRGLQKPGTFILRFPTSRNWPHPDAGNLVVTYVGADSMIHNKLISFHKSACSRTLQDLILEEPELSQLGRVFTR